MTPPLSLRQLRDGTTAWGMDAGYPLEHQDCVWYVAVGFRGINRLKAHAEVEMEAPHEDEVQAEAEAETDAQAEAEEAGP